MTDVQDTRFGSRVQLKCQLGYQMQHIKNILRTDHGANVTCGANGRWEPFLPTCESESIIIFSYVT